ncbi:MAG: ABC transporter ATP-binding protein [Deltaproteobacteria bacterium]|nr:ABC transporter ATP-binding protein [Deltaproteobacteria bacterium]
MSTRNIYIYKRLVPFIKPYWKRIALSGLFALPLSLVSAGLAFLMKPAIDEVFMKKDLTMLMLIPLAIIALFSVKAVCEFSYEYLLGAAGNGIINDIRVRLFSHIQSLSVSFFIQNPTGELMSRVTNDVSLVQRSATTAVIDFFKEISAMCGLIFVLFSQDVLLAALAMLIMPWTLIPFFRFGKKTHTYSTRGQEKIGRLATLIHETVSGCRIVKAFGMEGYENSRFDDENYRVMKIYNKRIRIKAMTAPVMEMIGGTAGAAVIVYGGMQVVRGALTPGQFFSFITALFLLYSPVRTISEAWQEIQEGLAAARRVFDVLDRQPEIIEKPGAPDLPSSAGLVCFTNVDFAYAAEPVLKDINLTVQPGEVIAIVGMTGSGKTSLVNLLPRFFDVTAGSLTINGMDVRDASLCSLRTHIALVSQQPYLFNASVHDNICYGCPGRDRTAVIDAARKAQALDFIEQLPEGFDTPLGERGNRLSGGQRQRVAIARAILKDAPILILDEATASLDVEIEKQIQQSLDLLIRTRTAFIISHRLSTIRNADRIIVLQHGRIVEQGPHDELYARGGEYTKLYSVFLQDDSRSNGEQSA